MYYRFLKKNVKIPNFRFLFVVQLYTDHIDAFE